MITVPLRKETRPMPRAALILSVVGGLAATAGRHGRPLNQPPGWRPECPTDTVAVTLVDSQNVRPISRIPLSGPVTHIPEFHDCQRFIIGGRYDALYAIFAAFRLESLPQRLRAADSAAKHEADEAAEHEADEAREHKKRGAAASAAKLKQRYGTVPVATIYSYGGHYAPLGIDPGFNCLFVFKRAGKWRARMVPWGPKDPDCANAHINPVSGRGATLEVRHTHKKGFSDADYPPVARWEQAKAKSYEGKAEYYIGIACGGEWCQIGRPGFVPSPGYSGPPLTFDPVPGITVTAAQAKRVYTIQGWYDDQWLAVQVGNSQRPGGPFGTFVPSPALDQLVHVTDFMKGWVHAASVVVKRDYKSMFTPGVNKIYLCHGPAVASQPNAPACDVHIDLTKHPCDKDLKDLDGYPWWARVFPANGGPAQDFCVIRRDHTAALAQYMASHAGDIIAIPGAARWRWRSDDDGEWIRCSTGCCTIIPG